MILYLQEPFNRVCKSFQVFKVSISMYSLVITPFSNSSWYLFHRSSAKNTPSNPLCFKSFLSHHYILSHASNSMALNLSHLTSNNSKCNDLSVMNSFNNYRLVLFYSMINLLIGVTLYRIHTYALKKNTCKVRLSTF